jgi:hypothetical protein
VAETPASAAEPSPSLDATTATADRKGLGGVLRRLRRT